MLEVLRRETRSWHVLLVGLVCTLLAVLLAPSPKGVYWARVEMMFLAPPTVVENPLRGDPESLIYFAAAVEREFNGDTSYARAASASATLYGRGVRNGYSVTVPSGGSQWQPSFGSPKLTIEVVETERTQGSRGC